MATIDGKDILTTWRMVLLAGSFDSLFRCPTRKTVKYTNYAEVDGITPALSQFETEPKKVSLNLMIRHQSESEFWGIYNDFFDSMLANGYRTLNPRNGLVHQLRYDRTQRMRAIRLFDHSDGGTTFTMDLIEDKPAIDPNATSPTGGIHLKGMYVVDGMDFGGFGIHPDDEIGEVLKYPDVKEPFFDGRAHHLDIRMLKHKEITLKFWMNSNSRAEFVNNYQAFYNAFAKTGKRQLYIREVGGTTEVYYMDCTAFKVNWIDRPIATFSIKLCIPVVTWSSGVTSVWTVLQCPSHGLLADENGRVLVLN